MSSFGWEDFDLYMRQEKFGSYERFAKEYQYLEENCTWNCDRNVESCFGLKTVVLTMHFGLETLFKIHNTIFCKAYFVSKDKFYSFKAFRSCMCSALWNMS